MQCDVNSMGDRRENAAAQEELQTVKRALIRLEQRQKVRLILSLYIHRLDMLFLYILLNFI